MKELGFYKAYKLYEVSEEDLEVEGAAGSRYIRNSILVFSPKNENPRIGTEICQVYSLADAKMEIDDFIQTKQGQDENNLFQEKIKDAIRRNKIQQEMNKDMQDVMRVRQEETQRTYF